MVTELILRRAGVPAASRPVFVGLAVLVLALTFLWKTARLFIVVVAKLLGVFFFLGLLMTRV